MKLESIFYQTVFSKPLKMWKGAELAQRDSPQNRIIMSYTGRKNNDMCHVQIGPMNKQ